MLRVAVSVWPQGKRSGEQLLADIQISNLTGMGDVADYELVTRPHGDRLVIRNHRRAHGWEVLLREALDKIIGANFDRATRPRTPAAILSLLPPRPYFSTACLMERDIRSSTDPSLPHLLREFLLPEKDDYAAAFHRQCRLTEKFTDEKCSCRHHLDRAETAA